MTKRPSSNNSTEAVEAVQVVSLLLFALLVSIIAWLAVPTVLNSWQRIIPALEGLGLSANILQIIVAIGVFFITAMFLSVMLSVAKPSNKQANASQK